jgi:hypothetical protein
MAGRDRQDDTQGGPPVIHHDATHRGAVRQHASKQTNNPADSSPPRCSDRRPRPYAARRRPLVRHARARSACSHPAPLGQVRTFIKALKASGASSQLTLAGFCLPKGLGPVLPFFLNGLLAGSAETRESAASGSAAEAGMHATLAGMYATLAGMHAN